MREVKEVKGVKEVKEVKAICFYCKIFSKKTIGFNFQRPTGAITSLNSITSELAKVQLWIIDKSIKRISKTDFDLQ